MASIVRIADINENEQYILDLEEKADDAQRMANEISNMISSSKAKIIGNVYEAFRDNLTVYQLAYTKLNAICSIMASAISNIDIRYSNYINECTDDDPVNARDHIPKYEAELIEEKAHLEWLLDYHEEPGPDLDGDGVSDGTIRVRNGTDAEIAACRARIAQLEEWLVYLRRLDGEVDPWAISSIESIENECTKFKSEVQSIKVTNIIS